MIGAGAALILLDAVLSLINCLVVVVAVVVALAAVGRGSGDEQ